MIKVLFLIAFFSSFVSGVYSQAVKYSVRDSLMVINLLNQAKNCSSCDNLPIFFARQFIGVPYIGGTLDRGDHEHLVVNLHEMDCTTFIEYVIAFSITAMRNQTSFREFSKTLKSIRYRDGVINGYTSRLHYFSDWIENNVQKGIIKEITSDFAGDSLKLQINYMSTHPDKYRQLKGSAELLEQLKKTEATLSNRSVSYLPKEKLSDANRMSLLKEGNIVAITTDINGLDIVHTGLIVFKEDGLPYLLHASLQSGRVKIDITPLTIYLQGKSNMTGIRILVLFDEYCSDLKSE